MKESLIELNDLTSMKALRRLTKIYKDSEDVKTFIKKVCYEYQPRIEKAYQEYTKEIKDEMFENSNRPLFSEETTRKILAHISEENASYKETENE